MRLVLACAALLGLAACSKPPTAANTASANAAAAAPAASAAAPAAPASGPAVAGVYTAGSKSAALTEVNAYKDEPFDGKPVTALVFSVKPQKGDANAIDDAHNGAFGDAIVLRIQPDGTIIGSDLMHAGLEKSNGYVSGVGMVSLQNYSAVGGQISGHLTSGGQTDVFGQPLNVDLTFHTKAP